MGWAQGLQSGMALGNLINQGFDRRALAEEAKKYQVTEGAYGPELQQNIEQVRALQAQNPEQAAQYEPAIAELTRRQGLTAPDYSVSSGGYDNGKNYASAQEAQAALSTLRTQGLANVYRAQGNEEQASALEARALQNRTAGLQLNKLQREEDIDKKIIDIDKQSGDFLTKRLTGEDGTIRTATADDMIAQIQHRASLLQKGGLGREATNAMKDWQGIAVNAIQLTSAQRNEDLGRVATAIAAGDLKPAQAFYDKYVMDGAKTTGITQNKDGSITVSRVRDDGVALPDKVVKGGANELLSALNSFRDPMSLYNFSQNEFKNNLQVRQVKATETSAQAALSRAKGAEELTKANKELIDARIENLKARTKGLEAPPPLTEAQITARARSMVTNGERNPVTGKKFTTDEAVKFVKSGGRDPVAEALDRALGGDTDPFAPD